MSRAPAAEHRATALWALSLLRPPKVVDRYRTALRDDADVVRRAALQAIGTTQAWSMAREVEGVMLKDPQALLRVEAIRTLALLGDAGVPGLRKALGRGRDLALVAAAALGTLKSTGARRVLRAALRHREPLVALEAARQLLQHGDYRGLGLLGQTLTRGKKRELQLQALNILALVRKKPEVRQLLEQARGGSDPVVRQTARELLEKP
jgi:HEAT repeat protein